MNNLKNEGFQTVARKVRSIKGWRRVSILFLVAAFAALSAPWATQTALADPGGTPGHTFNVTFTKWITAIPNMAGVVGGDVGAGTFAGEIFLMTTTTEGDVTTIHALYHMNGSRHSFTADNWITQDNVAGTAVIAGSVTEGWLKGAPVTGEYTVIATCPIPTPGNAYGTLCFQGNLHIHRGSGQ